VTILFIIVSLGLQPSSAATTGKDAPVAALSPASERFLIGNVLFTLLHEFGHVIIRDFEVPLLGLEENSADTLAAVSLVHLDRRYPEAGFAKALGAAGLAQALIWKTGLESENLQEILWAQHQLSAQRYARLVCLLYGSDPGRYGWLVEQARMNEIRADYCEDEWAAAERGARWVRDADGIPASGSGSQPSPAIEIEYAASGDARETALRELLERYQVLERLAASVQRQFAFPEPLTLQLKGCGTAGAFWDFEYRELVLCYELLQAYVNLAEQPDVVKLIETLGAGGDRGTGEVDQ